MRFVFFPCPRPCLQALRNERGATLMMVLVMVVVLGLSAGMAGSTWKTVMQREREAELLFRGDQIRRAIESYSTYRQGHQPQQQARTDRSGRAARAGTGTYPTNLEDLLRDPRAPGTVRHLRKLYTDPMTGGDWELIKDPGGRIKGVKSRSREVPFKTGGFAMEYANFEGAATYGDWQFVYEPGQARSVNTTAGGTVQGLSGMQDPSGMPDPQEEE